ncbi:ParA family protein [Halocatena pleomorpha]|uniref:ParA family protein n=1 Tax=Halocatena pleomorpha TaxID=1785090 RepID=A0A3P3RAH2_9EURY|nr:AAA family ATPase [Halocatena pleomorpha]RRJ30466.1 ParA family protein [Halocatena pleomorpha]
MNSLAVVGAVGGVGTTRTCLEFAGMLARDGRSVAVLDAAYATQGLSDHTAGQIDPDITALVVDETPLAAGLIELEPPTGRLACCPARAPFERLARAKASAAACRFEELIEEAAASFDHVLIDTPPVASNQAIAAVTSVDRIVVVTSANRPGTDGWARIHDRLDDLGCPEPVTVRTNADGNGSGERRLPSPDTTDPRRTPTAVHADTSFTAAVAVAVETVFDTALDLTVEAERDGLL